MRLLRSHIAASILVTLLASSALSSSAFAKSKKAAPAPVKEYVIGNGAASEPANANSTANHLGIAAVVGTDAISSYEVENRIKFIIITANLSDTPDVYERMRPQIVHTLIDERLQLQEAAKSDIKVSDKDLDQAIAAIEQERGMPPGTIYNLLDSNHLPRETFLQQIRSQISWSQLLTKKVRPQIHISDADVTMASQHYVAPPKKRPLAAGPVPEEFKIAVLSIPVDKPKRELEIRRLGDKLVKEVRGGANFEEVSRHFSSGVASNGGKLASFWIKLNQLDPVIAKVLSNMSANSITDPIRNSEGFTIIKVYETRSPHAPKVVPKPKEPEEYTAGAEVTLKEILLKLKTDAAAKEADMMLKIGEEVAKNPGTCEEKGIASIKDLDDFDMEVNFRKQMLDELPPAVKIIAQNLKVGDISTPFASREGIRLYMLCAKKEVGAKPVDRDEVRRMMLMQRMELEAQKYLRNLRRESFIDIR